MVSDVLEHAGFPAHVAAAVRARVAASPPHTGVKQNSKGKTRGEMSQALRQMLHHLYQPFNERMYAAIRTYSLKVSPCNTSLRFLDIQMKALEVTQPLTCGTGVIPTDPKWWRTTRMRHFGWRNGTDIWRSSTRYRTGTWQTSSRHSTGLMQSIPRYRTGRQS